MRKEQIKNLIIVPELNNKNLRELIEGDYIKIYEIINSETIEILTFHHSSKKL